MKIFLNKLKDVVKNIHISDQFAGLVILFTLCYLAFLAGIDWEKERLHPHSSTVLPDSSCNLTPALQKLEDMLEKVSGEQ